MEKFHIHSKTEWQQQRCPYSPCSHAHTASAPITCDFLPLSVGCPQWLLPKEDSVGIHCDGQPWQNCSRWPRSVSTVRSQVAIPHPWEDMMRMSLYPSSFPPRKKANPAYWWGKDQTNPNEGTVYKTSDQCASKLLGSSQAKMTWELSQPKET